MAFLITIEGGEGAGKSTLLKKLSHYLQYQEIKCIFTREPGGTPLGEKIRELLLNSKESVSPLAELFLYEGARAQHVQEVIRPALSQGFHVFCDRYIHSTSAYQGMARNLDVSMVHALNEIATQSLFPDLVIWLKIDPQKGLERSEKSGSANRFEEEGIKFHQAVYQAFLEFSKKEKNFLTLDASQTIEKIFQDLIQHPKWNLLFKKAV